MSLTLRESLYFLSPYALNLHSCVARSLVNGLARKYYMPSTTLTSRAHLPTIGPAQTLSSIPMAGNSTCQGPAYPCNLPAHHCSRPSPLGFLPRGPLRHMPTPTPLPLKQNYVSPLCNGSRRRVSISRGAPSAGNLLCPLQARYRCLWSAPFPLERWTMWNSLPKSPINSRIRLG